MKDLRKIFEAKNVASLLEAEELAKVGRNAIQGYEGDDDSRSEWKRRNKEGMKLAMQLSEKKTFPFDGAANVMYPLISIASIQFSSRAYPNLIPSWEIVKTKVIGKDENGEKANKAKRVATHMNYQLNEDMEDWESETDKLLTVLPILGCCFKETYFSTSLKQNISQYCSPEDIVMHYKAKSMTTVPRITKKYMLYPNEIIERIRSGIFLEFDIGTPSSSKDDEEYTTNDEYRPHLFLQQHTWLDLDKDGYSEPYVINIHKDTMKVVRIVPRFKVSDIEFNDKDQVRLIKARQHYTKFPFMYSPDGSIYDWGFGSLLGPINHTVNTTINQLLDAGTWANSSTGFMGRNINIGRGRMGGTLKLSPGELMQVMYSGDDLRKNIVMLNEFMREPSMVLFNLLGFMVNAGEKLSSVTELLMGEQTIQNEPATTSLARIEQGLKVFSSIHKRLHKSFGHEYKLLFDLNSEYLDPYYYYRVLDEEQEARQSDYDKESCDVIPSSNPEDVSNMQKTMKAQALAGIPGLNPAEVTKRMLDALQVPDQEALMNAPEPPPDPKLVLESEKLDIERSKLEFDMFKFGIEMAKMQSEIIKNLAEAEAKEAGPQIEQYKSQMQALVGMASKQAGTKSANN